jgi:hypothetical protein
MKPYFSSFQKPDHIKSLLNIRNLLSQSLCPSICVRLHELIFPTFHHPSAICTSGANPSPVSLELDGRKDGECLRNHLLEVFQRAFDFGTTRHIVFDFIDEWRKWDAAWICGRIFCISKFWRSVFSFYWLMSV